ncbi:MAG: protease complex subunit PrcB family protein [Candidatus Bathyarchaeia archaeon]
MRKRLFIALVLLSVVLTFLILQYFGVTSIGFRLNFQTIRKGPWGSEEAGYHIIQNAEDWAKICKKVFPPDVAPPEINFSNTTVIAVFMGEKPTAGFAIEVKEITDTFFRVVVKVAWIQYVGKGVAQVFTSPFHVIKVEKINKPVTFQTVWETEDC